MNGCSQMSKIIQFYFILFYFIIFVGGMYVYACIYLFIVIFIADEQVFSKCLK